MIDLRKSAELNGVTPIELYERFKRFPQSHKRIICYCEECGRQREISYFAYYDLCIKCANGDTLKREKQSISRKEYYSNQENRNIHVKWANEHYSNQENRNVHVKWANEHYSNQENRCNQSKRMLQYYIDYPVSDETREKQRLVGIERFKELKEREKLSAIRQGIPYDEWEGFAKNQLYCPDFNEKCKESNREKYDRCCFLSGLPEEENKTKTGKQQKLSVHHVDMDKGQGCDGVKWKLVPLCMCWHSKVHTKLWEARIIWLLDNVW